MVKIPFKRGDTFYVECDAKQNDLAQDITGWIIKAQVKKGSTLVADLDIAITDAAAGKYRMRKDPTGAQGTESWPIVDLDCDIQYTTATGQVLSTETFVIGMIKDVTSP